MNTFKPFQIGLIGFFAVLAIVAIVALTTYQSTKKDATQVYGDRIVVWGTLSQEAFTAVFKDISATDRAFSVVEYRQFDETAFDFELVNAIAEGRSPDLIVLSSNAMTTHRSKLLPISYDNLTERYIKDTFIDGVGVFMFDEGTYGLPFAVDPLVMYWNRDALASAGIAQAPRTWEELLSSVVAKLTVRDTSKNIHKSGLAFGEFRNVAHAKEVLLLLSLQTGSKMISAVANSYNVTLNEAQGDSTINPPLEAAVQFFTLFSNVDNQLYSWNRAMMRDSEAFLSGDLALYFGFGSEYQSLQQKNPNLNFDVASVPQGEQATALRTYGEFYSFAIPKASTHVQEAFAVANVLTTKDSVNALTHSLRMAPVRSDLIAEGDENPYRSVILQSALIARGWLDPGVAKSNNIFMRLIEGVVSNSMGINDAVGDAIGRLILAY